MFEKPPDIVVTWFRDIGIDVDSCYRVAIDHDGFRARIWLYVREDGLIKFDREMNCLVTWPPYDVDLDAIPRFVDREIYGDIPDSINLTQSGKRS